MVFAIAALLLHLAPTPQALPDVSVISTTPVVRAVPASGASASAQPTSELANSASDTSAPTQPVPGARSSTDGISNKSASRTLTVASLEPGVQNSQSFSTIRVPDVKPAKPERFIAAENIPSRRTWMLLSITEHSAAAFDAYSTRRAIADGAVEDDPMMRPFANSPAIYAAIQIGPAILDFVARRMQRSQNALLRHTWWVPQSASAGMFLFSGVHNMGIANHP